MYQLITRQLLRAGGIRAGLLLLLGAGFVSLLIGRQFLNRQAQAVAETVAAQRADFVREAAYHTDEIGLLLYYLRFSLVNETPRLAGLAIGQRDVNPSVQRVTIRTLEAQKYDSDLSNPANLLLGNLDFSFVLLYLFPLLIIAFCYNLISGEKEAGTWRLVLAQTRNPLWLVGRLFGVRILLVMSVLVLLLGLAVPMLKLPLDEAFWEFVGTSVLYVLGWFGVCAVVVSLQRSSATNALLLLTVWLGGLLILPALVNAWVVATYPLPEALDTTLKQRKGYHEKWDLPKQPTLDKFYAHYPQFRTYPKANASFDWPWYYAMQQLGDDEAAPAARDLHRKAQQRADVSAQIARFIPTLHAQLQLNELARTGLSNQLRFLDETTRFHERNRLYYYPKIFTNAPVQAESWANVPVETFSDSTPSPALGTLLVFGLLTAGFGWFNLRRVLG
jgi:ABC-2 type transport system permease protein